MSKQEIFICDECGSHRKETNHWFVVLHNNGEGINLYHWPVSCMTPNGIHLCGQECLQKHVSKWAVQP